MCQTPSLTSLPGGYAKTAKWLFTLFTSQAVLFFVIKHTVYFIGWKYL